MTTNPTSNAPAATWEPIDSLTPWDRNPRKNDGEPVDRVAASITRFGFAAPIVARTSDRVIIAGHTRWKAARKLGMDKVPVRFVDLDPDQAAALALADNRLTETTPWDDDGLAGVLRDLEAAQVPLDGLGWSADELDALLKSTEPIPESPTDDEAPEVDDGPAVSELGGVYHLGPHLLTCGDSTKPETWARIVGAEPVDLIHADPPYGMGKEADGVVNDNLYREKLDAFQMAWWRALRPFCRPNASAFVWGNAVDLWRLWWVGGLNSSERLELRNEIVWDKKSIAGMRSPDLTQFPEASERCLFFQFGNQFIGNVNKDDFPESWAPLQEYLAGEARAASITPGDVVRLCGCGMFSHWFSRSQFTLIPEKHYDALRVAYPGRFARPWSELKAEWSRVRYAGRSVIHDRNDATRSYFDNAHDTMRDVWEFPRVTGDDRLGHATPKPVAMIRRAVLSACGDDGIVAEPFGGTGTTLIACAATGRRCVTVEIDPHYCDVIRRRWHKYATEHGLDVGDGLP